MRKIELVEMVQDWLSGGDAPADVRGKYHPQIIEKYIEAAYNDLIYQVATASMNPKEKQVDWSQLDAFAQIFRNITVDDDADRGLKYSVLPFPPVKLPEEVGIRLISPEDDPSNPFAHVDNNSQSIFATLDVGIIDTVPSYSVEKVTGNEYRVYYDVNIGSTTEVTMLLILPFSQFDDYDEVLMPAGKDLSIIDTIVERLREKPQEDTINDNIVNQ